MYFTAYQLLIDSELDLPELLPPAGASQAEADVTIRLADLQSEAEQPGWEPQGRNVWTQEQRFLMQVPGVARFLIEYGQRIVVDPWPDIDADSVRIFLLGSALGVLLFQRGRLVLHGNAIRIGDACMICVGRSGAGKSTLAAGFMQRGYAILADDVVPLDEQGHALPGFPRIKLWQDSADKLGIATTELRRVRPQADKYNVPLLARFADQPLPVRWIYIIDNEGDASDGDALIESELLTGMHCFSHLHEHTYRIEFLAGMKLQTTHLQQCGQLAGRARIKRVRRPATGFHLDALIDYLLADMSATA